MKNNFYGVLDTTKKDIKMGEKENKKQSHSRMFLSGIFDACRCKIKGKIPELARVRLALSGSSTHVVIKQGNPLFNKRPTTRVEDPETSSGILHFTTTKANGFTLIELLVVVLILGILAAVALPQYQKAVGRSKYAGLKNHVAVLAQAQRLYYLANGQYASSLNDLDVQLPWTSVTDYNAGVKSSWGTMVYGNCSITDLGEVTCRRNDIDSKQIAYNIILEHPKSGLVANERKCFSYVMDVNSISNQICKMETGLSSPSRIAEDAIVWVYP